MRTTILIIAALLITGFTTFQKNRAAASLKKAYNYIEILEASINEDYLLDVISETNEYTEFYSDNNDRFNLYTE